MTVLPTIAEKLLRRLISLDGTRYNHQLAVSRTADDLLIYIHDDPEGDTIILEDESALDALVEAGYVTRYGRWDQFLQITDAGRDAVS